MNRITISPKSILMLNRMMSSLNTSTIEIPQSIEPMSPHTCIKPMLAVRAAKMRPCDCKDYVDVSKLEEQSVGHNDERIEVVPNYVLLKMGHTEIKISMNRFKMFAEWYLSEQTVGQ